MSFCKGKSEKLRWRKEQLDTAFLFEGFAAHVSWMLQTKAADTIHRFIH